MGTRTANGWAHAYGRLARDGTILIGVLVGAAQATGVAPTPIDAYAYYVADLDQLYPASWQTFDTIWVYPPPMAQILEPTRLLPWPAWIVGWTTIVFASLWYCARWAAPLCVATIFLPSPLSIVASYAFLGNVQIPMAAAIVAAFRQPGWWAVPLLTKITPGVGILWHVFRREWRAAGIGLGVTAAVAGVSVLLAPHLWLEFVAFALRNDIDQGAIASVGYFPVRFAAALVIVWWGARTNRPWTVPIASGMAILALYEWSWLPVWIGAIALSREPRSQDHSAGAVAHRRT